MDVADVRPVIVCGMPRSGTSYVASLLSSAGVFLGERLLGPSPANPRGHFEDLEFTDLHERMLVAQNAQMRELGMINDFAIEAQFETEALALVRRRAQHPLWGWKDTRNGLFLDFWTRLLPAASFVLIYRPPWEVVRSHVRRGDADVAGNEAIAVITWSEYGRRLARLRASRPEQTILGEVRGIARDEPAFLALMGEKFGYELRRPPGVLFESGLLACEPAVPEDPGLRVHLAEASQVYAGLEIAADFPFTENEMGPRARNPWAGSPET